MGLVGHGTCRHRRRQVVLELELRWHTARVRTSRAVRCSRRTQEQVSHAWWGRTYPAFAKRVLVDVEREAPFLWAECPYGACLLCILAAAQFRSVGPPGLALAVRRTAHSLMCLACIATFASIPQLKVQTPHGCPIARVSRVRTGVAAGVVELRPTEHPERSGGGLELRCNFWQACRRVVVECSRVSKGAPTPAPAA